MFSIHILNTTSSPTKTKTTFDIHVQSFYKLTKWKNTTITKNNMWQVLSYRIVLNVINNIPLAIMYWKQMINLTLHVTINICM